MPKWHCLQRDLRRRASQAHDSPPFETARKLLFTRPSKTVSGICRAIGDGDSGDNDLLAEAN